jgi:hypothetical protein
MDYPARGFVTNLQIANLASVTIVAGVVICLLVFRRKRREIALFVVALALSLAGAEVSLRQFRPALMEHDGMFQFDRQLGWTFIPSRSSSIVRSGEARHYVRTNAMGFRDNDLPTDPAVRRIMFVGDSFVSNLAVKDDEVFTELMERALPRTAVLNFGVNGFGPVQEYLLLQRWLDQVRPALVVVMIYVRNDFQDNVADDWMYARPVASLDAGGGLTVHPVVGEAPPVTARPWVTRSQVFHLARGAPGILVDAFAASKQVEYEPSLETPPELYLCRLEPSEKTRVMYRTMEAIVLKIDELAAERGIPSVFVLAPSHVQVDDGLWSEALRRYGETEANYARSMPNDRLMAFAANHRLRMVDLLPTLMSANRGGKTLYHRREQHWNREGNRVVAEVLAEYLRAEGLTSATSTR